MKKKGGSFSPEEKIQMFEKKTKPEVIIIKFNIMDFPEEILYLDEKTQEVVKAITTFGFTEEAVFGNYDLAERQLKVEYTN